MYIRSYFFQAFVQMTQQTYGWIFIWQTVDGWYNEWLKVEHCQLALRYWRDVLMWLSHPKSKSHILGNSRDGNMSFLIRQSCDNGDWMRLNLKIWYEFWWKYWSNFFVPVSPLRHVFWRLKDLTQKEVAFWKRVFRFFFQEIQLGKWFEFSAACSTWVKGNGLCWWMAERPGLFRRCLADAKQTTDSWPFLLLVVFSFVWMNDIKGIWGYRIMYIMFCFCFWSRSLGKKKANDKGKGMPGYK